MFTNKVVQAMLLAASLGVSGAVVAEPTFHSVPTDQGTLVHGAEFGVQNGKLVRLDQLNFNAPATSPGRAPRVGEVSADGSARYAGGEQGFVPIQHSYKFVQGKLVHTDNFNHSQPKTAIPFRSSSPDFVDLARGN